MYLIRKRLISNIKSSSRMASSLQRDSISFFQKLLRMFLNAFAMRSAPNLMMSLMQRLLSGVLYLKKEMRMRNIYLILKTLLCRHLETCFFLRW
jgi:hypothetical protein